MIPNSKLHRLHPRYWSFTTRLVGAMVLLVILTLSGVTIIINQIVQTTLTEQIGENFRAEAESLSDLVKVFFLEGVSQIQVLALSSDLKEAIEARNNSYNASPAEIRAEIETLDQTWVAAAADDPLILSVITTDQGHNMVVEQLKHFLEEFDDQSEVFITDRYGATIGATGRLSDYDQSDELWWQRAWNEGQGAVYISDPQFDESAGVAAFLIAVPVYDDQDHPIGILRSTLVLSQLFDLIAELEFGQTGYALVLNQLGQVIFDPQAKTDDPLEFSPTLTQHFTNSGPHVMVATNPLGHQTLFGHAIVSHEARSEAGDSALEAQIITAVDNLGWVVVVQQEVEEALSSVKRVGRVSLAVGIIAVIGASLLAILLAKVLTRPLVALTAASEEIGAGNLDTPLPQINNDDEIGRLTTSFEQMVVDLRHAFASLELRVKERTIELIQATHEAQEARMVAEQSNQAKSGFLANMSHELRTPLNGILGYAQILKKEPDLNDHQHHAIDVIHQSGEHLLTLLNDILDLSKIEAGRMDIQHNEFHFSNFLKNVIAIIQIRAKQKGLHFEYKTLSGLPPGVLGDEKRLRQVLINLLGNAVKFTETGSVIFKVGYHYDKIRFQIEDTGVGISPEHLEEIFSPFLQVGSDQNKVKGSGLGLAISRRLVEIMGSKLEVTSTLEEGSTFWFDINLPRAEGWIDVTKKVDPAVVGVKGDGCKVLVVDDKEANRSLLVSMLSPLGFKIQEAISGQDALDKATSFLPKLILMDLKMPYMDGFETTQLTRQLPLLEDVIIIAVSASAFGEDQIKSMEAGCDAFVTKPIRFELLLQQMQTHLNLEWAYAQPDNKQASLTEDKNEMSTIHALPAAEALKLYNLAMKGDIKGIKKQLVHLEQLNDNYKPIVVELEWLVKRYRIKQIRKLLQPYVEEEKNGQ